MTKQKIDNYSVYRRLANNTRYSETAVTMYRQSCISGACPRERGDCEADGRSSERQEEFTWENGM